MSSNQHTGNTARIRALLETTYPLSVDQICKRLGLSTEIVRKSLTDMTTRLGGAEIVGKDGRFRLFGPPGSKPATRRLREPRRSGVIAPPPYRTGFRWPGIRQ